MSKTPLATWRRSPLELSAFVLSFGISLYLAVEQHWSTSELVWNVWFASITFGMVILLCNLAGSWWRNRQQPLPRALVAALAVFACLKFIGLHWITAVIMPMAFENPANGGFLDATFWLTLGARAWPAVGLALLCDYDLPLRAFRRADEITPYLTIFRLYCAVIPAVWLKLFGEISGWFDFEGLVGFAVMSLFLYSPWRLGIQLESQASGAA